MRSYHSHRRKKRRSRRLPAASLFVVLVVLASGFANYFRPLPQPTARTGPFTSEIGTSNLDWPPSSRSALGAKGYGTLATRGPQEPVPTASIAKIITALAILKQKPLKPDQQGPTITLSQRDVNLYNAYLRKQGAVVNVAAGERISEYQALQAMLHASANNMADSLVLWAFGSMAEYADYANKMLASYGVMQTMVGSDASGFSPSTTSTPRDLVRLGEYALNHPVLEKIISQPNSKVPVAGTVRNSSFMSPDKGIIGIKTGLTDEAGGCLLYASKLSIGGQHLTLIGVTLGAKDVPTATQGAQRLMASAQPNFALKKPVLAGQNFGTYTTAWGGSASLVAQTDINIIAWKGLPLTPHVELNKTGLSLDLEGTLEKGSEVGSVVVSSGAYQTASPLTIDRTIPGPPFKWRLFRHEF